MSKSNTNDESKPALRRSSRSTRGSVKPIVDLSKMPDLEVSEDEPKNVKKNIKEDPVLVLSSEDEEEDYEKGDDIEISETKTKRSSKAASKKQPLPKVEDDSKQRAKPKATKTTARKSTAPKTASKKGPASKKSSKVEKEEIPDEDDEEVDEYDVDLYYELSSKEMKEVNNAFDLNCADENEELLSGDDLKTAIRSLGFEPRADEIHKLLKRFANKEEKINRDNFHKIMAFKIGSSPGTSDKCLNDEISKVFNLLDLDKTGMITMNNLKSIAKELNEEITDEELHEMIAEADLDGDFLINREEFHNIMKKTSLY